MNEETVRLIVSIFSGIAAVIPVLYKLIVTLREFHKEKNWSALVSIVSQYMVEAEKLYKYGSDKKAYVMAAIESSGKLINYNIDMEVVSELIDSLCGLSKKINVKTEEVSK